MTEQQKQNIARIVQKANIITEQNKREAVEQGDFTRSMQITNNQAIVEAYLRTQGVEITTQTP